MFLFVGWISNCNYAISIRLVSTIIDSQLWRSRESCETEGETSCFRQNGSRTKGSSVTSRPDFAPDKFINSWPATCRQEGRLEDATRCPAIYEHDLRYPDIREKVFSSPSISKLNIQQEGRRSIISTRFGRSVPKIWKLATRSWNDGWKFRYDFIFERISRGCKRGRLVLVDLT